MEQLVKQYFINKNEIRKLKKERLAFFEEAKCTNPERMGEYGMHRQDCIYDETLTPADFCLTCNYRHRIYLKLKKLRYNNIAIIRKLRTMSGVKYYDIETTPVYELREQGF